MAVPNQFADFTTELSVLVPNPGSPKSSDVLENLNCAGGFPLAEIVSLTGICLLAMICLSLHLARVIYYFLHGVEAGVFILDRWVPLTICYPVVNVY
jgi:hypothetical protein